MEFRKVSPWGRYRTQPRAGQVAVLFTPLDGPEEEVDTHPDLAAAEERIRQLASREWYEYAHGATARTRP